MKKPFNKKFKAPLTRQFLEEYYIKQNMTRPQIMDKFKLSCSKITKALKRFGITKPAELKMKKGLAELKTKEALEKMYCQDKLSCAQIAEKLNITTGAASSLIKRKGININPRDKYTRRRDFIPKRKLRKKAKNSLKGFFQQSGLTRERKKGTPCSDEKKKKLSEKAIDRGIFKQERTTDEIKAKEFLQEIIKEDTNIKQILEQVGIKIYQNGKFLTGYVADFLVYLKKAKFPYLAIEIDGSYHHNKIQEIKIKDNNENISLGNIGLSVARIGTDNNNQKVLKTAIHLANKTYNPILIIVKGVKVNILSKTYTRNNPYTAKLLYYNKKTNKVIETSYVWE